MLSEVRDTVMSESTRTVCERSNDLLSFLYGEASKSEASNFERHLTACQQCRDEMASFGHIRASISDWKDQALAGLAFPNVIALPKKKSAIAALREFFVLSPLWMKGAVGFTSAVFCVMAFLLLTGTNRRPTNPTVVEPDKYTKTQVDEMVAKAVEQNALELAASRKPKEIQTTVEKSPAPSRRRNESSRSTQWAKVRAPLSKSEREQLAADLRLLSTKEEDSLNLLGDRINQEF
jgi:hypothetical protein